MFDIITAVIMVVLGAGGPGLYHEPRDAGHFTVGLGQLTTPPSKLSRSPSVIAQQAVGQGRNHKLGQPATATRAVG